MEEIRKDVLGFEGYYQVSNLGKLKSLDRIQISKDGRKQLFKGKILNQAKRDGYAVISLWRNSKSKRASIHRLVLESFKGDDKKRLFVNHKDGKRSNNNLNNLEWCTRSENAFHGYKELGSKNASAVSQYTLDGRFISEQYSMNEAARNLGKAHSCISACCRGKQKTAYGFIWKYSEQKNKIKN